MQESWDYVMGQMLSFVNDTHADVDMAYDFVCEQLDISSFVDNETAWNDFYDTWEAADNRNDMQYIIDDLFTLTNIIMQKSDSSFMVSMSVLMMDIPATIASLIWQKLLRTPSHVAANFTLILLSTTSNLMRLK